MYGVGIANVTYDSSVVVGLSAGWSSIAFDSSDATYFKIQDSTSISGDYVYKIDHFNDGSTMILTVPFMGTTGNYSYQIDSDPTPNFKLPSLLGREPEAWLRKAFIHLENMAFAYVENG